MPIIRNNSAVGGASGMLGRNIVYRQMPNGETVIANKPKKRKGVSEKQEVANMRFSEASYYAKMITAKPEFNELYKRGITKQDLLSTYNVAIKDFMRAPTIEDVNVDDYSGQPGQLIRVRAFDDFKVTSVTVTITDINNVVIEKGEAIARGKKGLWRYTTTAQIPNLRGTAIWAVAKDLPGNEKRMGLSVLW